MTLYSVKILNKNPTHVHFNFYTGGGLSGAITMNVEDFYDFTKKLGIEVE